MLSVDGVTIQASETDTEQRYPKQECGRERHDDEPVIVIPIGVMLGGVPVMLRRLIMMLGSFLVTMLYL